MAGKGELVFIVDGNTSITGYCLGPKFQGSLTRRRKVRARVRLRVQRGKEITKLIIIIKKERNGDRVGVGFYFGAGRKKVASASEVARCQPWMGQLLGKSGGGGRGSDSPFPPEGLTLWGRSTLENGGGPKEKQRLRQGRDLVGRQEPHPGGGTWRAVHTHVLSARCLRFSPHVPRGPQDLERLWEVGGGRKGCVRRHN